MANIPIIEINDSCFSLLPNFLYARAKIMKLIANNWWPQAPDYIVFRNVLFRYSGFALFAISFIIFALAYKKLGSREKQLSLISMIGIFAMIFLARGYNNQILSDMLDIVADLGLAQLLGPMREWARVSIIIPTFLIIVIALGLNKIQRPKKQILIGGFLSMLIVNILVSPGVVYLGDNYAALYFEENWDLIDEIPKEEKVLLYLQEDIIVPAITVLGKEREIVRPSFEGTINGYGSIKELEDAPDELLDVLNIHKIIKFGRIPDHSDWDCKTEKDLTVCSDGKETVPFSVYKGTVLAAEEDLYSAVKIRPENFAITDNEEHHTRFIVNNKTGSGQYSILLFEAEDDFGYYKYRNRKSSIESSNGTIVISKHVQIGRSGTYELVARGKGSLGLNISESSIELESDSMENIHGGEIELKEGEHNLNISIGNGSILDFVSLSEKPGYEENSTSARIIEYEMINPTLWKVKIDSSEPFLLGFAESYSRFWELRMNGKVIEPIELYGKMNGYWIDEAGELEITMRYSSQDSYEIGMGISILTVILGSAYVWARGSK